MTDLRELYQEVVLEHSKSPRNFRVLDPPALDAEGFNPLCGDRVHVYARLEGDTIADLAFQGTGCAISTASASLMTQSLKGRSRAEADQMFAGFHRLITRSGGPGFDPASLGKLAVFGGVADYPVRVKCASLAWHTLKAALAGGGQAVSTE